MKSRKPSSSTNRRNFFKKAAFLGTAGIFGLVGRSAARRDRPAAAPDKTRGRGYRLTDHIRRYYERASL